MFTPGRFPDHQVHDWLIILNREVEHVWKTKWSVGKILYILSRYGPFFDTPIVVACESNFILLLRKHGKGDSWQLCHFIVNTAPYGAIKYDVSVG